MVPLNYKQTTALESLGRATNGILPAKEQKYFNISLFPNRKIWPFLNRLWDVVGNYVSTIYFKSQDTIEE